jgi:hypothetical protein
VTPGGRWRRLAGVLGMGGVAHAASHAPNGYVTIDSCTGVSGKIIYTPGMVKVKKPLIHAVLTGTTSGCPASSAVR